MGKIIRMDESQLIKLIGQLLKEVHDLDEVNDDVYNYVKSHPNERFLMSHEDSITFRDKTMEQDVDHKPEGLWYAVGSKWIDWVRSEMPEWETENVFSIEIDESKIKKISTYEEIMEFNEQYKKNYHGFNMINWRKVAQDYSGIEIAPYIRKASRQLNWYYTWDVASGCIWNQEGIKSIKKIEL